MSSEEMNEEMNEEEKRQRVERSLGQVADKMTQLDSENKALKTNVRRLLDQVGGKGRCKACNADIWWVKLKSGRMAPYTAEGLNHFADCPNADRFRR